MGTCRTSAWWITGWVRNARDGSVEVVAEGSRPDLEDLLVKLRSGPAHAEVEELDVEWGEETGLEGFHTY